MVSVAAHQMAVGSLGDRGVALRVVGLIVLAIGAYLAVTIPPALSDQLRSREAQLSIALYTVTVTAAGGIMAVICATGSVSWFVNDRLCNPASLGLLSITGLLGAALMVNSSKITRRGLSPASALNFPIWALGIWNTILLCYFWFGPANQPNGAQPNGQGTYVLESVSLGIVAIAVTWTLILFLRERETRVRLGRAVAAAGFGTALQVALLGLRAPDSSLSHGNVFGIDLMLSAGVVGVAVWFVSLSLSKRRRTSVTVAPAPARA